MNSLIPGSPGFVERLLAERIGLDVASVGEGLIARGVQVRMNQLGVRRLEDYQRILLGPTGEIQALIEEVVIPESWFFRDDRPFATFRELARSGWVSQPKREPLSVLCLPCAGGEEPYSVAIALLELGLARERFEVVAVDISERSILRATAGYFGSNAFRGLDPELQTRYFDFTDVRGRYLLKASIRSAVRFEQGNILDAGLLSNHTGFHVVFCRNLLIYFDEAARASAFANLDRLTAPDGYLFLGHADRPDASASTRFVPVDSKGSFLHQKQLSPPPTAPVRPPDPVAQNLRIKKSPTVSPHTRTIRPPGDPPEARKDPVVSKLVRKPVPLADTQDALSQAMTLADQGRYDEAIQFVHDQLGSSSLDAPAHFLLGIVHQAAGDRTRAEIELTKAIYLDPEHDEALLALALLARRKGDVAAEALFRRRAERVLARKGRSSHA